ncbi:hypothetical protein GCM10025856_13900 [Methylophaga marina]|nr:thiamine pyrophosphate-binding protein [Methylophaga marina]BDZ73671.1 hypothetical protein GCM10025856_13900 [Methylophaga marina]
MKTSDLLVKALENEGVEYIFGIPGEENLDFLDSLKHSSIRLIITRHEQGAGFMAANYGRLTGKPGVCLSTLGPGATNLVTPAAYAQLGGMPMLIITGQKPIKESKQALFQIVDVVNMMRPITKFTKQVVHGSTIAATVREAFRIAVEERPGAVHIELPEDIAAEEAHQRIYTVETIRRPDADNRTIQHALKMIEEASMPLLLIGAGANRKRASAALTKFVEHTGIPFFNTQLGKGVIDERHDSYLGTAALSESDFLHCAIERADLIINVGHDEVEKPPFFMKDGGLKSSTLISMQQRLIRSISLSSMWLVILLPRLTAFVPGLKCNRTGTFLTITESNRKSTSGYLNTVTMSASLFCRKVLFALSERRWERKIFSRWITVYIKSGLHAIIQAITTTLCYSTMPSPPWAQACPPQ